ncbi:hypothetical protein A7C99_3773 [Trichophyton rubrum]|uniref:Uncharacterized protein n=1 Tax=Trichophyton rubrum TaxID=5551 RepID=A0A178EZA1_TRIRU|nr:hypothetical protein A7C99_3773 [Trichophyton rubrum]
MPKVEPVHPTALLQHMPLAHAGSVGYRVPRWSDGDNGGFSLRFILNPDQVTDYMARKGCFGRRKRRKKKGSTGEKGSFRRRGAARPE